MTTIPLKQWIYEEAEIKQVSPSAIEKRFRRGKYPWLRIKKVNKRVVLVAIPT